MDISFVTKPAGPGRLSLRVLLLIAALLSSCSVPDGKPEGAGEEPAAAGLHPGYRQMRQKPSDTSLVRRRQIFDSLLAVLRGRAPDNRGERWRSADDLPREWVMVAMTDTAFVIYDPCDGHNPEMRVRDDSITVVWQLEQESHAVRNIEIIDTAGAVVHAATGEWCGKPPVDFTFGITLLDPATGLSFWRWQWAACDRMDERIWLMMPAGRAGLLPLIVHPCEGMKEFEYEFLELPEFPGG